MLRPRHRRPDLRAHLCQDRPLFRRHHIPRAILDLAPGRPSLLAVERVIVAVAEMVGKATYPPVASFRQVRCGQVGAHDDTLGGTDGGELGRRGVKRLLVLAAVVLFAGCGTTSAPKEVTSKYGIGATGVGERPVTVSGSGMMTTATFALLGSEYRVDWTARDTGSTSVGCYHATDLYDGAGKHVGDLGSGNIDGGASESGTTYLHNLQRGDHYVDASSGCEWTVTFTAP